MAGSRVRVRGHHPDAASSGHRRSEGNGDAQRRQPGRVLLLGLSGGAPDGNPGRGPGAEPVLRGRRGRHGRPGERPRRAAQLRRPGGQDQESAGATSRPRHVQVQGAQARHLPVLRQPERPGEPDDGAARRAGRDATPRQRHPLQRRRPQAQSPHEAAVRRPGEGSPLARTGLGPGGTQPRRIPTHATLPSVHLGAARGQPTAVRGGWQGAPRSQLQPKDVRRPVPRRPGAPQRAGRRTRREPHTAVLRDQRAVRTFRARLAVHHSAPAGGRALRHPCPQRRHVVPLHAPARQPLLRAGGQQQVQLPAADPARPARQPHLGRHLHRASAGLLGLARALHATPGCPERPRHRPSRPPTAVRCGTHRRLRRRREQQDPSGPGAPGRPSRRST